MREKVYHHLKSAVLSGDFNPGERLTEESAWHVVREYAAKAGIDNLAPHDLGRTCARLFHAAGGELEQIQFLLGHISIQTIERYLGCNSGFNVPSTTKSE